MIATKLKTNYLSKPIGIDPGTVVLTWIPAEGIRQSRLNSMQVRIIRN